MMSSSAASVRQPAVLDRSASLAASVASVAIRPVQVLIAAPAWLFLATLTLMLLRPPNVGLCPCDRIAFILLVFIVILRILLLREAFPFVSSITLPMAGLAALALVGTWAQRFDVEAWSLVAAKFVVPFTMFHLAALVFTRNSALRKLEIFCIATLAYLCFISIAFLVGAPQLVFPRFILDGGVEMHADRARGPFLQAVANGITINLLGLVVLHLYRRGCLSKPIAVPLLLSLPIAIFATMTRAVWLAFVFSLLALAFTRARGRWPRVPVFFLLGVTIAAAATMASPGLWTAFQERFADRSTVHFRLAVYQLSWDMVREKPLLGWGQGEFAHEIEARISDYRPESYAAHNTFIEILVEHGVIGMALYAWIAFHLFRVGGRSTWLNSTWPLILGVYFLNACFVVMNYQFVNAMVFTFAGVLAHQRSADAEPKSMSS